MHASRIAVLIAATVVGACGPGEPSNEAERLARGRELVQKMSDRLAAATAIRATTTEVRDAVHVSGSKDQVAGKGEYVVRRPDRFYAKITGASDLESWYTGKVVTMAAHQEKVFAQAPMPENINRTLDALAERYDMALPMGDLFFAPAAKALLADTTTGGYVGIENVGGTPCVHLAFKDIGADFELWIPAEGEPLPKRFRVVQKSRTAQPVIDVTFDAWDLAPQISDETFTPKVPGHYEGIAAVQRAAAVKNHETTSKP